MFARVVVVVVVACTGCDAIFGVDALPATDAPQAGDAADAPTSAPGLIAHYPLDSVSSSRAVDVVGGRDLACLAAGCPAEVASDRGGALRFDGTQLLQVDGGGALKTPGAFTVMAWVRIAEKPPAPMCPFGKLYGIEGDNSWQLCFSAMSMTFYTTSGAVPSAIPLVVNGWQHVALTWDGSNAQLLVDGNPRASASLPPAAFDDGRILVGYDEDGGAMIAPFIGDLDDLRVYARALSALEILSIALPPT